MKLCCVYFARHCGFCGQELQSCLMSSVANQDVFRMCITWIGWFQVLVIAMYGDVMSRVNGPSNNPFFKDKISR